MTMQAVFTKTTRYVLCPSCGDGEFDVSLLGIGGTAGRWYCDDCGVGIKLEVVSETLVEVETTGDRQIGTNVHLVLDDPSQLPLTIVVEGMAFGEIRQTDEEILAERGHHDRYFYEEHTCVLNFLKSVKKVIAPDGDDDRHGIFRWEKTVLESVDAVTAPAQFPLLQEAKKETTKP